VITANWKWHSHVPGHDPAASAVNPKQPVATRLAGGSQPIQRDDRFAGASLLVDPVKQNIYRYLPAEKRLEVVRDNPIDAANLFFDRRRQPDGRLLPWNGTVYSLNRTMPQKNPDFEAAAAAPRPGLTPVLRSIIGASKRTVQRHWRSAAWQLPLTGRDTFLRRARTSSTAPFIGVKVADVLGHFSGKATPGKPFYVSDERQKKTYVAM